MRIVFAFALLGALCAAEPKTELGQINGAKFRIDVPDNWNNGLVIYCHGYSSKPVGYDERKLPAVLQVFLDQGYALAQSGYAGEQIVVVAPTDVQPIRALSLAGAEQLRRVGMNVDLQEMEQGASLRKRQNQAPPEKGGWSAFFGLVDRSLPNTNPYGNPVIRADGLAASAGWPISPRIEALRAAWLDAGNVDEQRRICTELQLQLWQDVPYIPMGEYWQSTAYRKDLLDVLPGCFAVFWGIRRA